MGFDSLLVPPIAPVTGPRVVHTRVVSNRDTTGLGLVTVAIPWLGDVIAQVAVPAAGAQRGTWFIPQENDEVLVLLTEQPALQAYVIGCLWTSRDRPPRQGPQAPAAQMIRTPGGQELVFDELGTTVTLSTAEQRQELRMSTKGIDLTVTGGGSEVKISIGTSGRIEITGTDIAMTAQASLSLSAPQIEVKASGACRISGALVTIN